MAIALTTAARNAGIGAIAALIDAGAGAGTIKVYTGASPGPNTGVGGATLLATFTLDATAAFGSPSTGVVTLDVSPAITTTGAAAGTAGFFRAADSTGASVLDGSVTATGGGGDLELNTTTVSVGLSLEITSGTLTQPQ